MPTNQKLAAAAHVVIRHIPAEQLGATKLNKVLWFADCEYYRKFGRSLTGETAYVRRPNGPCPSRMEQALEYLKSENAVVEANTQIVDYTRREFTSVKEPNYDAFKVDELAVLMGVAIEIAQMTAKQASDASHGDLWHGTEPNGLMSVEAGSVRFVEPTAEDIAWARAAFAAE